MVLQPAVMAVPGRRPASASVRRWISGISAFNLPLPLMAEHASRLRRLMVGEGRGLRRAGGAPVLALLFCSVLAGLSARPGWSFLLFPELAAIATTVLEDPWGSWGRQPWALVLLPALAAVAGLWISLHVSSMVPAVLVAVLVARLLLLLFRSPLAPTISAAALPVILRIHSWSYPLQITLGLVAFTALLLLL
ncbi:MAG: hypothetical protein ACKO0M_07510, partial [Cyanobium sp.]